MSREGGLAGLPGSGEVDDTPFRQRGDDMRLQPAFDVLVHGTFLPMGFIGEKV